MPSNVYVAVSETIEQLVADFDSIPAERKELLEKLAGFVKAKGDAAQVAELIFICTHNSRRSHMAQIWAQTGAEWYGIRHVKTYSGGTEATAFNPRAVAAMKTLGFQIEADDTEKSNPVYTVRFGDGGREVQCFSKTYDDPFNPGRDFGAVMTCSDADEACPIVVGAAIRIPTTYYDPKAFDGTEQEAEKYLERSRQIGTEMLYAMSVAI